MIVSYKNNFVFVKTKKTAGTSMEVALCHHTGPDDIMTPIGLPDEFDRYDGNPNTLSRNFSDDPAAEDAYRGVVRRRASRKFRAARLSITGVRFYNHMAAVVMKERLDSAFWDRAFKFTIERHPYEKAISLASMHSKSEEDFAPALDGVVKAGRFRNFGAYSDKEGNLLVDYVIRYEALDEGVRHVEDVLGIQDILSRMPRSKSRYRFDRRPAKEILNDEQKLKIQTVCKAEFDLLGYEA